jgi:1,4-dihydroxy-2-naphthoate octaprenyltransferase
MSEKRPGFFQKIRAPFLSSILTPLIVGTLLSLKITGDFNLPAFILILIGGVALHIATNVYNDIYDTIQGTDKVNVHRNEFSGGSGILLNHPELMPGLFWIARYALILALLSLAGLTCFVNKPFWPYLWGLYLLSAFFSKFYTAAPIKLAYRGLGEISVWFAFGPMAISFATISQNVEFSPAVIAAMSPTGLSTLSILLIGQLIDLQADKSGGKLGVAARFGTRFTFFVYLFVQLLLVSDVFLLGVYFITNGWSILLAIIPYFFLLPSILKILYTHHDQPDQIKKVAGLNVQLHLLFSLGFIVGMGISNFL